MLSLPNQPDKRAADISFGMPAAEATNDKANQVFQQAAVVQASNNAHWKNYPLFQKKAASARTAVKLLVDSENKKGNALIKNNLSALLREYEADSQKDRQATEEARNLGSKSTQALVSTLEAEKARIKAAFDPIFEAGRGENLDDLKAKVAQRETELERLIESLKAPPPDIPQFRETHLKDLTPIMAKAKANQDRLKAKILKEIQEVRAKKVAFVNHMKAVSQRLLPLAEMGADLKLQAAGIRKKPPTPLVPEAAVAAQQKSLAALLKGTQDSQKGFLAQESQLNQQLVKKRAAIEKQSQHDRETYLKTTTQKVAALEARLRASHQEVSQLRQQVQTALNTGNKALAMEYQTRAIAREKARKALESEYHTNLLGIKNQLTESVKAQKRKLVARTQGHQENLQKLNTLHQSRLEKSLADFQKQAANLTAEAKTDEGNANKAEEGQNSQVNSKLKALKAQLNQTSQKMKFEHTGGLEKLNATFEKEKEVDLQVLKGLQAKAVEAEKKLDTQIGASLTAQHRSSQQGVAAFQKGVESGYSAGHQEILTTHEELDAILKNIQAISQHATQNLIASDAQRLEALVKSDTSQLQEATDNKKNLQAELEKNLEVHRDHLKKYGAEALVNQQRTDQTLEGLTQTNDNLLAFFQDSEATTTDLTQKMIEHLFTNYRTSRKMLYETFKSTLEAQKSSHAASIAEVYRRIRDVRAEAGPVCAQELEKTKVELTKLRNSHQSWTQNLVGGFKDWLSDQMQAAQTRFKAWSDRAKADDLVLKQHLEKERTEREAKDKETLDGLKTSMTDFKTELAQIGEDSLQQLETMSKLAEEENAEAADALDQQLTASQANREALQAKNQRRAEATAAALKGVAGLKAQEVEVLGKTIETEANLRLKEEERQENEAALIIQGARFRADHMAKTSGKMLSSNLEALEAV